MLTSSQYKQYGQHIWLMFAIYLSYITFINKSAICFLSRDGAIIEVYGERETCCEFEEVRVRLVRYPVLRR